MSADFEKKAMSITLKVMFGLSAWQTAIGLAMIISALTKDTEYASMMFWFGVFNVFLGVVFLRSTLKRQTEGEDHNEQSDDDA